jgi:hypothetical protein
MSLEQEHQKSMSNLDSVIEFCVERMGEKDAAETINSILEKYDRDSIQSILWDVCEKHVDAISCMHGDNCYCFLDTAC